MIDTIAWTYKIITNVNGEQETTYDLHRQNEKSHETLFWSTQGPVGQKRDALRISSLHVAEHMKDEVTTIVALLYDVVEEGWN